MTTIADVLRIVVTAEDQASAALRGVGDSISSISEGASRITGPLADLTDRIIGVDSAALGAGAALVGLATAAADDFETAFREIATMINAPVEGLQDFRQSILDYASSSTQSLDQITKSIYSAISAGVDYKESVAFVAAAEKLAVAGRADLGEVTKALAGTLNAYGASTKEAASYSDTFFKTVALGQTTIPELASSISGVTSTATLAGVSFDTLGAALATLTGAGAPTSEAITRLNAVLNSVIKPSGEAQKMAAELGLSFDVTALKTKGLATFLAEVQTATGGSAEKMAVLFGSTEALNAATVLGSTNAAKFASNLTEMAGKAGATSTAFETMAGQMDVWKNSIAAALVSFGDGMREARGDAEDALGRMAEAFKKAVDAGALKGLQDAVNDALGAITEQFDNVAKNLPTALEKVDWSQFLKSMRDLGSEFASLFEGVDLSTPEGLAKAIQAIVDTGTSLNRVTGGIVEGLKPWIDGLKTLVTEINGSDEATQKAAGSWLGFARGLDEVFSALGGLGEGIASVGTGLEALAGVQAAKLIGGLGGISAAAATTAAAWTGGVAAAGALGVGIGSLANLVINKTAELTTGVKGETLGTFLYGVFHDAEQIADAAPRAASALNLTFEEISAGVGATARLSDSFTNLVAGLSGSDVALNMLDLGIEGVRKAAAEPIALQIDEGGATEAMKNLGIAVGYWADAAKGMEPVIAKTGTGVKGLSGDVTSFNETLDGNRIKTQVMTDALGRQVVAYSQIGDGTVKATGGISIMGDAASSTAKKIEDATKKSESFKIKLEEIASNERIKMVELQVQLETAKFETDMERVKATFESLNTGITSTGDVISAALGAYSNADGFYEKFNIERQLQLENKWREQNFQLQKELTQAEIERINEQAKALARGDALIRIDGGSLAPELEAFMWKILKAIRVRANAEFQDYLLGLGVS